MAKRQVYHTNIWEEEAEDDNPFATKAAYCHGYDVYGDVIKKATWFEYLYLLFKGEKPSAQQAKLLEVLAIALANPGPREASVRAAMNGGVAKTTHASSLMCALAVGAGQYGGSHEIYTLLTLWSSCGLSVDAWCTELSEVQNDQKVDIWQSFEHAPGFDPNTSKSPTIFQNIFDSLVAHASDDGAIAWLRAHKADIEENVGYSLSLTGIVSAVFFELGFDEHESSMLYLILRLPGAAIHALEQRQLGWKKFPFFADSIALSEDPGDFGLPEMEGLKL